MELTEEKLESMLDRKFATLKQSLDEVVNTLSFLCNQYDDLQKTVVGLQEENKKLQNENKSLRAEVFTIKNELKVERGSKQPRAIHPPRMSGVQRNSREERGRHKPNCNGHLRSDWNRHILRRNISEPPFAKQAQTRSP